jgi:cytochrome c oxidase subunit III
MSVPRRVVDVRAVPLTVFGSGGLIFWGTIGFMLIEGTMLVICIMALFYVRKNFEAFPPLGTPIPDLLIPTIGIAVSLLSIFAMRKADRQAREFDQSGVARWLVVCCVLGLAALVLRAFEFDAVNTRWDHDAYGSAVWAILVAHTSLLLMEMGETLAGTVLMHTKEVEDKHFVDMTDNASYWHFVMLAWIPCYLAVYWGPRWF